MTKLKTKPNGVYYLDTQVPDGKGGLRRARVGLDTKDKEDAQRQYRDWVAGIHAKHPAQGGEVAPKRAASSGPKGSGRSTFDGTLVSDWLSKCLTAEEAWGNCRAVATHKSNAKKLREYLPDDLVIEKVNSDTIKQLKTDLTATGYAPASVHKLLTAMQAACRFAVEEGVLRAMPKFDMPDYDNKRERVLTVDEQAALQECFMQRQQDEPLRAWWHMERLLWLALETGCRKTELLLAGPSWVKRKKWTDQLTGETTEAVFLAIPKRTIYRGRERVVTKSAKPREVPLTRRGQVIVAELTDRAVDARFFPWSVGTSAPTYFLQNLRDDMRERGFNIDDVVLHTMRHTCATRLCDGGIDIVALKDWLGHHDIKVTCDNYLHMINSHTFRGVAILDAYGIGTDGDQDRNRTTASEKGSNRNTQPAGSNRAEAVTPCHA